MISLIISSLTRIIFITIPSIKVVLSRHDEVLCGIFLQIQPKKFQRKKIETDMYMNHKGSSI